MYVSPQTYVFANMLPAVTVGIFSVLLILLWQAADQLKVAASVGHDGGDKTVLRVFIKKNCGLASSLGVPWLLRVSRPKPSRPKNSTRTYPILYLHQTLVYIQHGTSIKSTSPGSLLLQKHDSKQNVFSLCS